MNSIARIGAGAAMLIMLSSPTLTNYNSSYENIYSGIEYKTIQAQNSTNTMCVKNIVIKQDWLDLAMGIFDESRSFNEKEAAAHEELLGSISVVRRNVFEV